MIRENKECFFWRFFTESLYILDNKSGGHFGRNDVWNVECPAGFVAVGLKKTFDTIVAMRCAQMYSHNPY